jgi:hypothetical protein
MRNAHARLDQIALIDARLARFGPTDQCVFRTGRVRT